MKKIFTLGIAVLFGINLIAQPTGWQYTQPIVVHNPNAQALIDYQLSITVNTQSIIANNGMLANGDDIRFGNDCFGTTLYNYWIEAGINTPTTIIWVKIDTLPANATKTIYMYSGNSAAMAVSAVQGTFRGPNSATDSVTGGTSGGLLVCQRGFRFSPNQNILVTHFGKNEPTGSTRYVTLFNYSSQAILSQTQIAGPAAQYTYGPISSPLWLTANTQYVLQIYGLASDGYYYGASSQIGQHLTYYDMQYSNGGTQNTFPNSTLANYHYGYGDFLYYITTTAAIAPTYTVSSPAPTTLSIIGPTTSVCAGTNVTLTVNPSFGQFSWNTNDMGPTLTLTAQYTFSYAVSSVDPSNCTGNILTAFYNLIVDPSPETILAASSETICNGDSVTITATGAVNYDWNNGMSGSPIVVSPSTNAVYTTTGSIGNCTDTQSISIEVKPSPTNITVVSSKTITCPRQPVTILAGGGSGVSTFSWNTGTTGAQITVSPSVTTSYTVSGANIYGCSKTAVYTHSVSTCAGINEIEETFSEFKIIPNPNAGEFILEATNVSEKTELKIYNSIGQLVHETQIRSGNNHLNLKELSNGLYHVVIKDMNGQIQKGSFIKN